MKKSLGMAYAIKKKNSAREPMARISGKDTTPFNKAIQGASPERAEREAEATKHLRVGHKYAQGGPVSAKTEARPMPGHEEMQKNALPMSKMLDKPTEAQAISNNGRMVKPIKHPSMVQSPVFKVKLRSQEDDLISSKAPAAPQEQPEQDDNEEGADRQGPAVHKMKMMAKGGSVKPRADFVNMLIKERKHQSDDEMHAQASKYDEASDKASHPEAKAQHKKAANAFREAVKGRKLAKGGLINDEVSMHDAEEDEAIHPMGLESDDDQMAPHEEEFMSSKMPAYAEGGRIEPMDEEEMEHYDSMAAAIMAKRDRQAAMSDSEDDSQEHAELPKEDHQEDMPEFAKGGPIKSHPSIYSDDSSEVDLSRNADEDANEEDQLSFNALRKENYDESDALNKLDQPEDSNEHGDEREDRAENKLDKVDRIMSKMSKSKKFK